MIHVVEESLNISIHYPSITTAMEILAEFKGSTLWSFTPSVTMATRKKIFLVDG
jgi:hypothetical protein